jgi:hypothetical protein
MGSGPYSTGPLIMGATWAEAILATIAVAFRAYCAIRIVRKVEWDLFWVVFAWCATFASEIFLTISVGCGYGRRTADLSEAEYRRSGLYIWLGQLVSAIGAIIARIAIIAMLLRVQGEMSPKTKWTLHVVAWLNVVVGTLQVAMIIKICPLGLSIAGGCDYGLAHSALVIGYVQAGLAVFSDLFLASYAVIVFRKMKVSPRRKLAMSFLMGGGYVVAVAAIMRLVSLRQLRLSTDSMYHAYPLIIWTYTEVWLILILGSLPRLHSLFLILKHKFKARNGSSVTSHFQSPRRSDPEHQSSKDDSGYVAPWAEPVTISNVGVLPPVSSTLTSTTIGPKRDEHGRPVQACVSLRELGFLPSISDSGEKGRSPS